MGRTDPGTPGRMDSAAKRKKNSYIFQFVAFQEMLSI
jgi:hypothetical protein